MNKSRRRAPIAWAVGSIFVISPLAGHATQQTIGDARIVVNDVRSSLGNSAPETIRAGVDVVQNEVIRTGDRSASKVLFQDNTTLSIGAFSEVTLDRFVFDPNPQKSQIALSIAKGALRFATGSLPKGAYKITTPTATIGVRGTILTVVVAADGATSVSVEEGAAMVSAAGETVAVETGMTTTAAVGKPPTTPSSSDRDRPAPIVQMDSLLNGLAPGGTAGMAAVGVLSTPVLAAGILAVVVGVTIALASDGGRSSATTH